MINFIHWGNDSLNKLDTTASYSLNRTESASGAYIDTSLSRTEYAST